MNKAWTVITIAGLLLLQPLYLPAGEITPVQLAGIRVTGPGYGVNGSELRAFSQSSGISLSLLMRAPKNKMLVEIDSSKCALLEFSDDKGINLLADAKWGGFPKISKTGKLALIEVKSKGVPSKGAVWLHARGTIRLRAAASQKTVKIENVKLKSNETVNVLDEIIKVLKIENEKDSLRLVIQVSRNFKDNLKDIRFYTSNGSPLKIWGRGSFSFGNAAQLEYNLATKRKPENLDIEFELWRDIEELDQDFDLKIGLGL